MAPPCTIARARGRLDLDDLENDATVVEDDAVALLARLGQALVLDRDGVLR